MKNLALALTLSASLLFSSGCAPEASEVVMTGVGVVIIAGAVAMELEAWIDEPHRNVSKSLAADQGAQAGPWPCGDGPKKSVIVVYAPPCDSP